MQIVARSVIHKAAVNIIHNPNALELIAPGVKRNRLAAAIQDYLYKNESITCVENALAYSLGYNIIEG